MRHVTTYTTGDLALSINMFLTGVDMTDGDDSESPVKSTRLGVTVYASYGVTPMGTALLTSHMVYETHRAGSTACHDSLSNTRTEDIEMLDPVRSQDFVAMMARDVYVVRRARPSGFPFCPGYLEGASEDPGTDRHALKCRDRSHAVRAWNVADKRLDLLDEAEPFLGLYHSSQARDTP